MCWNKVDDSFNIQWIMKTLRQSFSYPSIPHLFMGISSMIVCSIHVYLLYIHVFSFLHLGLNTPPKPITDQIKHPMLQQYIHFFVQWKTRNKESHNHVSFIETSCSKMKINEKKTKCLLIGTNKKLSKLKLELYDKNNLQIN